MPKAICTAALASFAIFGAPLAIAQSKRVEATNPPDHPFQVEYPAGSQLSLYLRSGDFRVVGGSENKVSVRVDAKDLEKAREVRVTFDRTDQSAALRARCRFAAKRTVIRCRARRALCLRRGG